MIIVEKGLLLWKASTKVVRVMRVFNNASSRIVTRLINQYLPGLFKQADPILSLNHSFVFL